MEAHAPYSPPPDYDEYGVEGSIADPLGITTPHLDTEVAYDAAARYLSDTYQ